MSRKPKARQSRRERKIRMSLVATALGLVGLTAAAVWIDAGRDTDLVDGTAAVTSRFKSASSEASPVRYRDVAASVGLVARHGPGPRGRTLPEDTGSGLAWGDYDGDGDWDLYLVGFPGALGAAPHPEGGNHLFRNDAGHFTDVSESAGVQDLGGFGMGASFADYDEDGALDLYVTNRGPNRLFHNLGDGTFEEVAERVGLADELWSAGVAWGDIDRDGDLDLYVCNYVVYDVEPSDDMTPASSTMGHATIPFTLNPNAFDPSPNRLYLQLSDGTFEDAALECGVADPRGRSLGATMCDLDGDGWLDLYVNNDVSTNRFYRNLSGETTREGLHFVDASSMTGTADPRGSMGLSVGEIGALNDRYDGLPDLFITHWVAQENAFYQSLKSPRGTLEYRDKTRLFRLGEIAIDRVGWGSCLFDMDLDGRLDLAVVNGSTLESKEDRLLLVEEPMFLFWNDGTQFNDVAAVAGDATRRAHGGRGLAAADFDGDGDVDLAVSVNRGSPLLLRNDTETTHRSLAVRLEGPAHALFGASVEVVVGERRQMRWYGADVSYLSMHAPELIFGLGEADRAAQLSVHWADGKETRLEGVSAGRLALEHGAPGPR